MIMLELSDQERNLLLAMLDREIGDLGPEIHHTDSSSYRSELKSDRQVLTGLRKRLLSGKVPADVAG